MFLDPTFRVFRAPQGPLQPFFFDLLEDLPHSGTRGKPETQEIPTAKEWRLGEGLEG